jgi:hypothetical protein
MTSIQRDKAIRLIRRGCLSQYKHFERIGNKYARNIIGELALASGLQISDFSILRYVHPHWDTPGLIKPLNEQQIWSFLFMGWDGHKILHAIQDTFGIPIGYLKWLQITNAQQDNLAARRVFLVDLVNSIPLKDIRPTIILYTTNTSDGI